MRCSAEGINSSVSVRVEARYIYIHEKNKVKKREDVVEDVVRYTFSEGSMLFLERFEQNDTKLEMDRLFFSIF